MGRGMLRSFYSTILATPLSVHLLEVLFRAPIFLAFIDKSSLSIIFLITMSYPRRFFQIKVQTVPTFIFL